MTAQLLERELDRIDHLQASVGLEAATSGDDDGRVRALRAGGIAAPVRADAGAVRLLTIHGAKGLEAHTVLILDTEAQPPRPESMGVLVDWPGE